MNAVLARGKNTDNEVLTSLHRALKVGHACLGRWILLAPIKLDLQRKDSDTTYSHHMLSFQSVANLARCELGGQYTKCEVANVICVHILVYKGG